MLIVIKPTKYVMMLPNYQQPLRSRARHRLYILRNQLSIILLCHIIINMTHDHKCITMGVTELVPV